jgi:hypothetical protein
VMKNKMNTNFFCSKTLSHKLSQTESTVGPSLFGSFHTTKDISSGTIAVILNTASAPNFSYAIPPSIAPKSAPHARAIQLFDWSTPFSFSPFTSSTVILSAQTSEMHISREAAVSMATVAYRSEITLPTDKYM